MAVFLAGALSGAAATRAFDGPRVVRRFGVRVAPAGSAAYGELNLSPTQRAQIDSVLARMKPRSDSLLKGALPQLKALVDSADTEIRRILTRAQRTKLDSLQHRVVRTN